MTNNSITRQNQIVIHMSKGDAWYLCLLWFQWNGCPFSSVPACKTCCDTELMAKAADRYGHVWKTLVACTRGDQKAYIDSTHSK